MTRPIDGSPTFRPATRLILEGSHRPPVTVEQRDAKVVAPMWLRHLRADTREQVL